MFHVYLRFCAIEVRATLHSSRLQDLLIIIPPWELLRERREDFVILFCAL